MREVTPKATNKSMTYIVKWDRSNQTKEEPAESLSINEVTGKQIRAFSIGGQWCHSVILTGKRAHSYVGYARIEQDLLEAKQWLTVAYEMLGPRQPNTGNLPRVKLSFHQTDDSREFKIIKALWFSAIVLYAKCFTSTNGRNAKLEEGNVSSDFRTQHTAVMDLRNTIVAHAGKSMHELGHAELILAPSIADARMWIKTNVRRTSFADDRGEAINFEGLVDHVLAYVRGKMASISTLMIDCEILPRSRLDWLRAASILRRRERYEAEFLPTPIERLLSFRIGTSALYRMGSCPTSATPQIQFRLRI